MRNAVTIRNVTKTYPRSRSFREYLFPSDKPVVTALKEINVDIESGEIFGLLGPNGSGKTTLQKIVCGLLSPTSGTVSVNERAAYVFDGERTFYWRLTGRQNLEFFAALSGCEKGLHERIAELAGLLELDNQLDKMFLTLSAGNRQKLSLIRALMTNPAVLVMDEPTRSLDPIVAQQVQEIVRSLVKREGMTVIWATHNLSEAEHICDRAIILNQGRIIAEVAAESVRDTYINLMSTERQVAACE